MASARDQALAAMAATITPESATALALQTQAAAIGPDRALAQTLIDRLARARLTDDAQRGVAPWGS